MDFIVPVMLSVIYGVVIHTIQLTEVMATLVVY